MIDKYLPAGSGLLTDKSLVKGSLHCLIQGFKEEKEKGDDSLSFPFAE